MGRFAGKLTRAAGAEDGSNLEQADVSDPPRQVVLQAPYEPREKPGAEKTLFDGNGIEELDLSLRLRGKCRSLCLAQTLGDELAAQPILQLKEGMIGDGTRSEGLETFGK
jgi:hypothetical protein